MSRIMLPDKSQNSLEAKLRRLKIQEDILFQNLTKQHCPVNQNAFDINNCDNVGYHKFLSDLSKTYFDLHRLFDEVKTCTHSQETLKVLDIDDIKNNVFELENNIRSFKKYIQNEMVKLKSAETSLAEANNKNIADISNVRKRTKKNNTPYCEIVPSPVGVLMNSPFKCTEVQQFQEFMMNSQSRYGGWNEYHHNIFVKTWHKYFHETNVDDPDKFDLFLQELLHILEGFTEDEIVSHNKWYSKYIYLRERQQRAINKWKSNRMKLKKEPHKDKATNGLSKKEMETTISVRSNSLNNLVSDGLNHINVVSSDQFNKNNIDTFHQNEFSDKNMTQQIKSKISPDGFQFLKPTAQWRNRCKNDFKVSPMCKNDIEIIKKLRKPNWRIGL